MNVFYKYYSKIVTSRLKVAILDLISTSQSRFVLGRDIHDNLLRGHELIWGYAHSYGTKRVAIMIDIKKAPDLVKYDAMLKALHVFESFPSLLARLEYAIKCLGS